MFLLYFRFSPKDTGIILLLPLAFTCRIEYAVPIIAGLLFTPGSAVGVAFGVIITRYLTYVEQNKAVLGNSEIGPATVDNFRNIIDALLQNKAMWIMAAAFAAAVIVVYFIRRLETAHSWTIAIIVGTVIELFVLLFGDMQYDTNIDLTKVFMGVFLSILVELLVEFFSPLRPAGQVSAIRSRSVLAERMRNPRNNCRKPAWDGGALTTGRKK